MHHLGLDFGTTTSVLSYHDGQRVESFKLGGAAATPYIPSALSIDKTDHSIQIGKAALLNQGDDDYEVFTYFKMLLAEQNPEKLEKYGYKQHLPSAIAKEYLRCLLTNYQQQENISTPLQRLVITVPEIWVREGHHAAREVLKNICDELQLSHKLLSEPVAACVYFAHRFRIEQQRDFCGHVLVFDYGGGTLDLSLSAVEGSTIKVLEGAGKGYAKETLGVAGVAFDEAVVRKVSQHTEGKYLYKLLREFEDHKVTQTDKIAKSLAYYHKNILTNRKLFTIDQYPIETKDLVEIFEQYIHPELNKSLLAMYAHLQTHQVDINNGEQFRVVMVGGFSNFYLVRRAVKDFFQSRTDADSRFNTGFDLSDTALAISKGAALVANNVFEVEIVCPISVGIRVKNQFLKEEDRLLLYKNVPLSAYQQPQFLPEWLEVMSEKTLDSTSLKLFLDVGDDKRRYLDLQGKLRDFIPNPRSDNKWKIGFSVNEDLVFTLHVEDSQGHKKSTPLGNLEKQLGGLHISESA